jgi:hypothetical protein
MIKNNQSLSNKHQQQSKGPVAAVCRIWISCADA